MNCVELRSSSIDGVSVSAQASRSAGYPISECKSVYSGSIPTSAFPRVGMAEILDLQKDFSVPWKG